MRTIILLAVVLSCFAVGFRFGEPPAVTAPTIQQSDVNIAFEWAFGVLSTKGKMLVPVALTRDTILKSGDEIKMMVKLTKECFVYVVHQGSKGEVSLLFPYDVQQFQKDYVTEKNYYIPKGRDWMKLDKNTGKEIFFLVASTERLLDLESKLGNYLSADASKKQTLADDVVSEIRGVRKRYSTFATIAEKPLTIGGNIRGTEKAEGARRPDVANIATQITAKNFFSKTITIDHQ
jgi:hypothetical protein